MQARPGSLPGSPVFYMPDATPNCRKESPGNNVRSRRKSSRGEKTVCCGPCVGNKRLALLPGKRRLWNPASMIIFGIKSVCNKNACIIGNADVKNKPLQIAIS
ncbi:hypothetical protein HMPREF1326_02355 [Akkermansia sp. KLE1605]|nr:hypothetical protein HMPREF1326_02355 [Akkermansia sp. KLE1605]